MLSQNMEENVTVQVSDYSDYYYLLFTEVTLSCMNGGVSLGCPNLPLEFFKLHRLQDLNHEPYKELLLKNPSFFLP